MAKTIDLSQTVYELCRDNPEVVNIMKGLGFEQITNPAMLKTAGRWMTLRKGAKMKGIPMEEVKTAFLEKGYTIKEQEGGTLDE